ncbi:MAG: nitroreductase/quinone reductase family protein [Solirubrobacterales bacterium]
MGFGAAAAEQDYCYLTTTGRVSGEPREIEIWFGLDGSTLYMLSGGGERSNWVRNLLREPAVTVRIGSVTQPGRARVVEAPEEDERARRLLFDKYSPRSGGDLGNWRRTAVPIAVDLPATA